MKQLCMKERRQHEQQERPQEQHQEEQHQHEQQQHHQHEQQQQHPYLHVLEPLDAVAAALLALALQEAAVGRHCGRGAGQQRK